MSFAQILVFNPTVLFSPPSVRQSLRFRLPLCHPQSRHLKSIGNDYRLPVYCSGGLRLRGVRRLTVTVVRTNNPSAAVDPGRIVTIFSFKQTRTRNSLLRCIVGHTRATFDNNFSGKKQIILL